MKAKFKIKDKEQCKRLQEKLFSMGIGWRLYRQSKPSTDFKYLSVKYLFVDENGSLTWSNGKQPFLDEKSQELHTERFIAGGYEWSGSEWVHCCESDKDKGDAVDLQTETTHPEDNDKGLRFNKGKVRRDLEPAFAQEQYAQVLTKGAEKYADRNWEKGMKWSKVLASMKRHVLAYEKGEDYDPETGLLHTAHIMCNAAFLTEYYKIYPQGDDRPHSYLTPLKIGLDIDEVLADFIGAMMERFPDDITERSEYWNCPNLAPKFKEVVDDESFWMGIKPTQISLPFEPHCYITSRSIDSEITERWLSENGYPKAKVYTVGVNKSKVEVAKESGIDIFVDDRYENFVELNREGICCYLWDAPHNQRYDVGHKRIKELSDLLYR